MGDVTMAVFARLHEIYWYCVTCASQAFLNRTETYLFDFESPVAETIYGRSQREMMVISCQSQTGSEIFVYIRGWWHGGLLYIRRYEIFDGDEYWSWHNPYTVDSAPPIPNIVTPPGYERDWITEPSMTRPRGYAWSRPSVGQWRRWHDGIIGFFQTKTNDGEWRLHGSLSKK